MYSLLQGYFIAMHYIISVFKFFQQVLIQILTQRGLMADVLKQYVEGLEELDTHVASRFLTQDVQEEGKHVLLQEEAEHVQECTHKHTQDSIHNDLILRYDCQKEECFSFAASRWNSGSNAYHITATTLI